MRTQQNYRKVPFEGRSARTLFQKTVVGDRAYLLGQCLLGWFQSLPMRGSFVASVAPRLVRVSVDHLIIRILPGLDQRPPRVRPC